jgi:hypothetical protein
MAHRWGVHPQDGPGSVWRAGMKYKSAPIQLYHGHHTMENSVFPLSCRPPGTLLDILIAGVEPAVSVKNPASTQVL